MTNEDSPPLLRGNRLLTLQASPASSITMSVDRLLGYHSTDQLSSTETVHEASLAYAAEPRELEQRLARVVSLQHLPLGNFSKQNRNGKLRLELSGQEDNIELPEYSQGARIQGTLHVNMEKENGIASVSIKVRAGGLLFYL